MKKLEVEWDTYRLYEKSRVSSVEDVTFLSECEVFNSANPPPSPVPQPVASPAASTSKAVLTSSQPSYSSNEPCCSKSLPPCTLPALPPTGPLTNFTSKRGVVVSRGVQHRYPFLLKIAYELDLPASFSGTYGYIAYKLVVFIRASKKGVVIGTLKDICIFPILDLNHLDHSLQRPVHEKRVFKSLFGYNYVFMKCHLDKRAFLPEELVTFTVEITNKSPATLEGVEVNLIASTQFSIYGASKIENLTLLRIRGPCIGQGEHAIWSHSFNFPISSYPTGFGQLSRLRSKSIDLQYSILFTLEVSKAEKFAIPFPIVIGTVPFGNSQSAGTRALCINHHQSLEEFGAAASSCSSSRASSGSEGGGGGRRSGGSITPSSSTSGASTPGHYFPPPPQQHHHSQRGSSRHQEDSRSSTSRGHSTQERPPCSGGFCCTVRGHHPSRCRPRSKSTSALPPTYSAANLYYQCVMLRRAETRKFSYSRFKMTFNLRMDGVIHIECCTLFTAPPTYHEAKRMGNRSNAATP